MTIIRTVSAALLAAAAALALGSAASAQVLGNPAGAIYTDSAGQALVQASPSGANVSVCAIGMECVLGVGRGLDFNATTDQAITLTPLQNLAPLSRYKVTKIWTDNCSTSLTTAQGGLYTAVSKGGTIIGATTTPYTGCTASTFTSNAAPLNNGAALTNEDTKVFNAAVLYLSLTTAQGTAATADVYIVGVPLN